MSLRNNTFTVLVAVLLFTATIAPFAGVASAATVHESVVGGDSPRYVHADVSDMSGGEYTVEVYAPHSEIDASSKNSGWRLIYQENAVSTSSDKDGLLFENWGAYTEVKVRIEATNAVSGSPTFGTGRAIFNSYKSIGYTGGDSDLKCSFTNNLHNTIVGSVTNVDCKTPVEKSINVTKTDANETRLDIHAAALSIGAQQENNENTRFNYLEDTKSVARIEGKNAYIRALENGSTESVARQEARTAVLDYYSRHQIAILEQRAKTLQSWNYLRQRALNETGISQSNTGHTNTFVNVHFYDSQYSNWQSRPTTASIKTKTVTLANGSQHNYTSAHFTLNGGSLDQNEGFKLKAQKIKIANNDDLGPGSYRGSVRLWVDAPTSNYEPADIMNLTDSLKNYNTTVKYANQVSDEVDTFANETYDKWQDGKINTSDLVDPYLAAREYGTSNQSFQTWSLSALSSLDVSSPETLDKTGKMEVTTGAQTYTGILLSDGLPENDTFQVGETYNPDNLTGSQFVVTDSQTIQLEKNFTLDSATTKSGESLSEVKYRNITYKSSTLDDYKNLLANLSELSAQIEAREQTAIGGGSGTGADDGSNPFEFLTQETAGIPNWAFVTAAGGALIIATRQ
jgi:hypothetical protein